MPRITEDLRLGGGYNCRLLIDLGICFKLNCLCIRPANRGMPMLMLMGYFRDPPCRVTDYDGSTLCTSRLSDFIISYSRPMKRRTPKPSIPGIKPSLITIYLHSSLHASLQFGTNNAPAIYRDRGTVDVCSRSAGQEQTTPGYVFRSSNAVERDRGFDMGAHLLQGCSHHWMRLGLRIRSDEWGV